MKIRRSKIAPFALGALAVLSLLALPAAAQSVDEIVDAHIKAIGGADAAAKIKSLQRSGEAAMSGVTGEMSGTYELVVVPGKKAYQNMDLGAFGTKTGYNGEVGWDDNAMRGLRELEGEELGRIQNLASLDPLLDYRQSPSGTLEKRDDETVGDQEQYVLELAAEVGPPISLYIDKKTYLLTQVSLETNNPQMGPMKIVFGSADYEEFNGLMLATQSTIDIGDGMITFEYTFSETTVNGKVDESIFEMPQ